MKIKKNIYSGLLFFILLVGFYFGAQLMPEPILKKLDNAGIVFGYVLLCFSSAIALHIYFNRHLYMRPGFALLGETLPTMSKAVKAVIIPVSRTEPPEWIIRWLKPQEVALIYTEKRESRDAALALVANYHGTTCKIIPAAVQINEGDRMLSTPDNPVTSKTLVRNYINEFLEKGYKEHEIFVDVTGGKTAMSLGMFQAAEEMRVATIYISGKHDGKVKKPTDRDDAQAIYMSDPGKKGLR